MIDITNPYNPIVVGSVKTRDSADDVAVSGDIAYVADCESGLFITPVPIEIVPVTVNDETSISLTLPGPDRIGNYKLRVFRKDKSYELFDAVTFTVTGYEHNTGWI